MKLLLTPAQVDVLRRCLQSAIRDRETGPLNRFNETSGVDDGPDLKAIERAEKILAKTYSLPIHNPANI